VDAQPANAAISNTAEIERIIFLLYLLKLMRFLKRIGL
jgi:hypothetical protein